jgi:RNA polymerase sigma-70 factor (ECF subfamily)
MDTTAREMLARQRWESLYRRFHRRLVAHVRKVTDDGELAQDVAHEVFLAALVQLKAGCTRPSWPWLRALATRLATTREWTPEPAGLPVLGAGTPEPGTYPDEVAQAVAAAFESLPPRDRLVLSLRYQEGWTQAEIGRLLRIEPGTVQALASRARRRLQLELQRVRGVALGAVAWVAAGRRRAQELLHRLPAAITGEEAALVWRILDRAQPLVGVMATSAATLSLATVLSVPGQPASPGARHEARPVAGTAAASPAAGDHQAAAGHVPAAPVPTTQSSVDARVSPGVRRSDTDDVRYYEVSPAAASMSGQDVDTYDEYGSPSMPVSFECPDDVDRRALQALGCPVLEAAHQLVPAT